MAKLDTPSNKDQLGIHYSNSARYTPMASTEYTDVLRITPEETRPLPGYTFIQSSAPLLTLKLCRDLTLARGRILYEVWPKWNSVLTGYVVPSSVAAAATKYQGTEAWPGLVSAKREELRHAHGRIVERFPRMHPYAAVTVAENAVYARWDGTKRGLEDLVVAHVFDEWTSYDFRLRSLQEAEIGATRRYRCSSWETTVPTSSHLRQAEENYVRRKDRILETVKPRMRDVLRSWLPAETTGTELALFWQRHRLFDLGEIEVVGSCREQDVVFTKSRLMDYGGAETVANLVPTVGGFLCYCV